ncbi:hypothetical protein COT95_02825 [Candidatus Falkowbacteria bacterium CG10_big_fil_rev_8_21_14_0_10_37_6]|uniref:Multidrug resistance protein MdtA-like C-terminal permuted SH3 domain-containing protein n=1 Tax=Candidatus Falkowbacteria bacterium CG10_big_fil_rev_8_21_14_0_10_37_6 TaxID=1974563 RepID=A0A2H0V6G1_9BACT|nr:MAG: hypothetical protein COT95_02825 [Candidatus Falkowbacteria bacterium CG10_big_fil_rev_8_21_14_0_10_37_6]
MLKIRTIIIFLIVAALLSFIAVYFVYFRAKQPEYVTETVKLATLSQTVEATGKVESAQRVKLSFRTGGRIAVIDVDSGDKIKKGQVLARLEASALQSRVADAQAQLDKARADYDALLAGASLEDIQVSKDVVEQKKLDLESSENTLKNLELTQETEVKNLKEAVITTLKNEIVTTRAAAEQINNTLTDDDAKNTLSITNQAILKEAKEKYSIVLESLDETSLTVNFLSSDSSDSDVSAAIEKEKNMLSLTRDALTSVMEVLQATITSSDLSEAELDALKTNIQAQQSAINSAQTALLSAQSNWTNKIAGYDNEITTAKDNIGKAKAALKSAESQLALKAANPREFEINSQKAKISQAQAAVSLALANLEETIIRAPLDGIVTKKFFEPGEQASLSEAVLEMIGQATLEIEVDIPESDIAKIKIGGKTIITLDAFGDDVSFDGIVSFVDPAETIIQDVVYYKVIVQFETADEDIKPGMTANATILTDEKQEVLVIPFRAVKSRNGDKYVEVLANGTVTEKTVTLGLRGDEGIEIISGLQAGDVVITFTKE